MPDVCVEFYNRAAAFLDTVHTSLLNKPRRVWIAFTPSDVGKWGEFYLLDESDPCPVGGEMLTPEPVPLSLDRAQAGVWFRERIGRLPMLPR